MRPPVPARPGLGLTVAAAAVLLLAPAPATAKQPWPPIPEHGHLFAHLGEEHINDADGATILPKVVRESARFRPDLVTMSGDKANDGETEQLELWADVMDRYDRAGIPWFAGVGNHDRKAPSGAPGGVSPVADFSPYRSFFADRPYPMGDEPGYDDPKIRPRRAPLADQPGASSHYFADYGGVRWIFLDNSCFSIIFCDSQQNRSGQNASENEPQLDFLRRVGAAAGDDGKLVFVVMHMPTRDPGDQLYREPTALQHTMGKTALGVLDNTLFEQAAVSAGADAVFVAHIKGQFLYRGEGDVPYFIDGGSGGELYTQGPIGTDHGYWHGFRLISTRGQRFRTDSVPIFVPGGINIAGSRRMQVGEERTFEAFGRQPVFNDPAKVEALELRDPNPTPRTGGQGALAWLGDAAPWLGPPLALLLLGALGSAPAGRRRLAVPAVAVATVAALGGVSVAQQSEPTSTPVESLPNPARVWTSSNPSALKPVASETDDARRNARKQTTDGTFRAVCPGHAKLRITSGFETKRKRIVVRPGDRPAPARC